MIWQNKAWPIHHVKESLDCSYTDPQWSGDKCSFNLFWFGNVCCRTLQLLTSNNIWYRLILVHCFLIYFSSTLSKIFFNFYFLVVHFWQNLWYSDSNCQSQPGSFLLKPHYEVKQQPNNHLQGLHLIVIEKMSIRFNLSNIHSSDPWETTLLLATKKQR